MKVLVLDNYDSFTYNLVQYIQEILGRPIDVFRNDEISLEAVDHYDVIILSPGPGLPREAGIMPQLIKRYAANKPILGVCLGHQAIGEAFGGQLENLTDVYHGIETDVQIIVEDDLIFQGVAPRFRAGRYHSWVVSRDNFPQELEVTAVAENEVIMAMRHREYPVWGVQFHPESIMTAQGMQMLENFLEQAAAHHKPMMSEA